jgi:hypothetical protein
MKEAAMIASISESTEVADRLERLEGELAELRHTMSELAEIVVGDIKDRREAAFAVSSNLPEISIPPSLVPGGQATLNTAAALRRPWLLIEFFREIGATVRMFLHPRYQVRRSTQFSVMLIVGLLLANYLVFNVLFLHIPVVSEVLERLIDIVLAVMLYKVVNREVQRYQQALGVAPRAWTPTPVSLLHNDPDTAAVTREESP